MSKPNHLAIEHSRITVGIVTYNSTPHIRACLNSIAEHLSDAFPIVLVLDNASSDSTLSLLVEIGKKYPLPLEVITQDTNHGYAWGANRLCELVRTEWICLINPDARLLAPAFQHAKETARRAPTCGVIGGILTDIDGNPQECGGVFPTPSMAVWDWSGLRKIFPRKSWSTNLKLVLGPTAAPRQIDYPTGAFWMLRREVYQRVGPFDEQFFLYFEETDFCKRAAVKGWPSFIHPAIRVEHHRGASFPEPADPDCPDPLSIYFESLVNYLTKHFPAWQVKAALATISYALKTRVTLFKDHKSERILKAFEDGRLRAVELKVDDESPE